MWGKLAHGPLRQPRGAALFTHTLVVRVTLSLLLFLSFEYHYIRTDCCGLPSVTLTARDTIQSSLNQPGEAGKIPHRLIE
jgi:hypothetical protein